MEGYGNENPGAFQPTRPLRGATTSFVMSTTISRAISTHAPLAGRDGVVAHIAESPAISTHAPLAGRDAAASSLLPFFFDFNPRAPCGARRQALPRVLGGEGFQPTRPLRGATPGRARSGSRKCQFQPTRPLRGATRLCRCTTSRRSGFQPTRPLRGATESYHCTGGDDERISTHAPLAGRGVGRRKFQPTRPLRGATLAEDRVGHGESISTHAPLAGRDAQKKNAPTVARHFNPRAPCGARQLVTEDVVINIMISTHAPLAGRDSKSVQITMHIFAITDKFQMLLHRMPPVRAFCSFLTQENHADLGANRPSDLCALVLRTIRSSVPRADTSACSRSVRFYSRTSCPSSKIEGCPFLGQ